MVKERIIVPDTAAVKEQIVVPGGCRGERDGKCAGWPFKNLNLFPTRHGEILTNARTMTFGFLWDRR